jgi:SPP1 family phage portal protein
MYNKRLYDRFRTLDGAVPIFKRQPHFSEERKKTINNKLCNNFLKKIVNFKTGYFAGEPISYGYSKSEEAEQSTGGAEGITRATKALTDFITRNNMFGVDMSITRYASIYGYAGRLFYVDYDGELRTMAVHGFETIVLSNTNISEPDYAIRYYPIYDINNVKSWVVEFYDDRMIYTYNGGSLSSLQEVDKQEHGFASCPLQGIANNDELQGDAEDVFTLIDNYDQVLSDNANEIESFANAYMIFKNLRIDDEEVAKGRETGCFIIPPMGSSQPEGSVEFVTKDNSGTFIEQHLARIKDNIYNLSDTPDIEGESFGNASGVGLKFKLHPLETKCAMYEAKVMDAAQYMWRLLSAAWAVKNIVVDPLQITMDFTRNFPLDITNEAQAAQTLIAAGLPKQVVYAQLSFVDDVDYVLELIEQEKGDIPVADNYDDTNDNSNNDDSDDKNKELNDDTGGGADE